ncbi:MAG: hypothetical protein PHU33_14820, partial [Bacteroidales bacterium]|nr:hypothetical protein [Bacteroidales bacterium]
HGLNTHGNGGGIANIDDDAPVTVAGDAVETTHALSLHALSLHTDAPNNPHHRHPPSPQKTIGQQRFRNQGKNTLSSIIGSYKSAVTKHAHRLGYDFKWQSRFHEHIIRDDKSYRVISEYIINNPRRWNDDMFNGNHGY